MRGRWTTDRRYRDTWSDLRKLLEVRELDDRTRRLGITLKESQLEKLEAFATSVGTIPGTVIEVIVRREMRRLPPEILSFADLDIHPEVSVILDEEQMELRRRWAKKPLETGKVIAGPWAR